MRLSFFLSFTFISFIISSQTATISGKILDDATELGIPFATVQVKDTDKGTTSDIDGNFSISAEKKPSVNCKNGWIYRSRIFGQ